MHTVNYVHLLKNCIIFTSPCSLHVNSISYSHLICYRRVWQLEMHVLNFCTRHCDLLGGLYCAQQAGIGRSEMAHLGGGPTSICF